MTMIFDPKMKALIAGVTAGLMGASPLTCTCAEIVARGLDECHLCRWETPHTHNEAPYPSRTPYGKIALSAATSTASGIV
jgi:hypothetical protein